MKINKKIQLGVLLLIVIVLSSICISATYMSSNPQYTQYNVQGSGTFDSSMCQAGTDFIIQIAPFGCTPAVVRDDLLEEQDVPVFCQIAATQINPLIDVEAIDSISFSGQYPPIVKGIGFHPASAALGVQNDLNTPILSNIGYVVILLRKQTNTSAIPNFVIGNLTAKIKYDVKNTLGVGSALFYLPEFENEEEWISKKSQYGFWNGKGYLRAEDISSNGATISVYNDAREIASVNLQKGETSEKIAIPGFECTASLRLKLGGLENPDTRAQLRINAEVIEVGKGEKFLENKCQVKDLSKRGLVQRVILKCQEDTGTKTFSLIISPRLSFTINGEEKEVGLGDYLYDKDSSKKVFLGYIGTKGNSNNPEELGVYLVALPRTSMAALSEAELSSITSLGDLINSQAASSGIIDITSSAIKSVAGLVNQLSRYITSGQEIYRLYQGDEQIVFGREVSFSGFADAQDIELDSSVTEYYNNAKEDYETIRESYSTEPYNEKASFGEEALYNEIVLAWDASQKITVLDLCAEFEDSYPNSEKKKEIEGYCKNNYGLSNQENAAKQVTINGVNKEITFDRISEPNLDEYGVHIQVSSSKGNDGYDLKKNQIIYLSSSSNDFIQLISADDNSASIKVSVATSTAGQIIELEKDVMKKRGDYSLTLTQVNLKKLAKVSVIPGYENAGTEAKFGFKIGIEKRNVVLVPEKIREKIINITAQINKWQNYSDSIGKGVEALKSACLVTGAALVVKNFLANVGGMGIARQQIMRGVGGWFKKCDALVASGNYISQDDCLLKNSDQIDKDVKELNNILGQQNSNIKELEEGITKQQFLTESVVDTKQFMKRYILSVTTYLNNNLETTIVDPSGKGEPINKADILSILSYANWEEGKYTKEQLRDIELYARMMEDASASQELRDIANARLYSVLSDVMENSANLVQTTNWASSLGVPPSKTNFIEVGGNVRREPYQGLKISDIGMNINGFSSDTPIALVSTSDGRRYIIVLDDSSGLPQIPIMRTSDNKLAIYDSLGAFVENPPVELTKLYFEKFDSTTYQNQYKNPQLRYYETEPYKGLPAIVPFDLKKGWYAATKQTLPVGGNIQSYDASGRVSSFYLCNVGPDGLEENIGGNDICQMINTGTGMPYNVFPGLSETEAKKYVDCGVSAIEQASRAYKSGISGTIKISTSCGTVNPTVGSPAVDTPQMECQDFMSPKECLLLFNLCDPVICPSSRCDLGGAYPVKDVIQSGIIGSLVLCLPNIREGIVIPVCLTGVKAGIDGLLSVMTSYRDCLQESLDTGKMVGICDEIYSIYMCEFLWKQALPIANLIIPKMIEILLGQNVRGGGEYLGVANAWSAAEKSINYFTQYYGANSMKAFQARTTEGLGTEICKVYVSGVYPEGGNLLDTLVQPDSPPQFHGRFDEIPFTSATVPSISQYKVFYHIYAGKDSGVYYKVYLAGIPGSSYYQDTSETLIVASGYVAVGSYATETKDFTAPSGYKELCINVNGQEECGFKEISTSFAVNYIEDLYLQEQANQTDIQTEAECISGTASAYSLLNPNTEAAAEELINPAIYNEGIIRICATLSPGKGTDPYYGTEDARWKRVGYCGDETMKCWLDTQSVEDVIITTTVEGETLEDVTDSYLDILQNEEGYLSEEQFESNVTKIKKEDDPSKRINLINGILEKVFLNNEKAELLLLRGNAYYEIMRIVLSRVIVEKEKTLPEIISTATPTENVTESSITTLPEIPEELAPEPESAIGLKIWQTAKNYAVSGWDEYRVLSSGAEEYTNVCTRFVIRVMIKAGVTTPRIVDVSVKSGTKELKDTYTPLENMDSLIPIFTTSNDFVEVGVNKLERGDIVMFGFGTEKTQHIIIFDSYTSDGKYINGYGDPGKPPITTVFGANNNKVQLEKYPIKSSNSNELYFYRAFRYTGDLSAEEKAKEEAAAVTHTETPVEEPPTVTETSMSKKILQTSINLRAQGSTGSSVQFVSKVLIGAGVQGITSTSSVSSLVSMIEKSKNFFRIYPEKSKGGDILITGSVCNIFDSASVLEYVSDDSSEINGQAIPLVSEISNGIYVSRAYRYVGDLSETEKNRLLYVTQEVPGLWDLTSAIQEIDSGPGGSYTANKVFVDQLIFDGILTKADCEYMRGINTIFGSLGGALLQKNMNDLRKLLLQKCLYDEACKKNYSS